MGMTRPPRTPQPNTAASSLSSPTSTAVSVNGRRRPYDRQHRCRDDGGHQRASAVKGDKEEGSTSSSHRTTPLSSSSSSPLDKQTPTAAAPAAATTTATASGTVAPVAVSPFADFMRELQKSASARSVEIVEDNPRLDLNLMVGDDSERRRDMLRKKLSERSLPSSYQVGGAGGGMMMVGGDGSTTGSSSYASEQHLREKRDRRWEGTLLPSSSSVVGKKGMDGADRKGSQSISTSTTARDDRSSRPTFQSSCSPVCPKRRRSTECIDETLIAAIAGYGGSHEGRGEEKDDQQHLLDERWGSSPISLPSKPGMRALTRSISCDAKLEYRENLDDEEEEEKDHGNDEDDGDDDIDCSVDMRYSDDVLATNHNPESTTQKNGTQLPARRQRRSTVRAQRPVGGSDKNSRGNDSNQKNNSNAAIDELSLPEYGTALEAIRNRYAVSGQSMTSASTKPRSKATALPCIGAPSIPIRRESVDCIMLTDAMRANLELQPGEGKVL